MKEKIAAWWKKQRPGRKALYISIPSIIAVFYVGNLIFYLVSTRPRSCTLCHYMRPYYEQWKTSTHKNFICLRCHPFNSVRNAANTLKYLTNTYNPRPIVEVKDQSCLQNGCHSERLLEGNVLFKGSIAFDHKDHYGKAKRSEQLRCVSCHSQIVQGAHIAVEDKVCILCHFKGAARGTSVTRCPSCHGTPTKIVEHEGFSFSHESYLKVGVACNQCHMDVAKGEGNVPQERCHSCHVERLENFTDRLFIHNVHVTGRGIYCFKCHEEIVHGEIKMIQALEVKCEMCHERTHSPQKEMYMGTSGKGVKDTPSRMFAAQVSCDGCHTHAISPKKGEKTLEAERRSCVVCHGKGYDLMLDDWRREISRALSSVEPVVTWGRQAVKGLKGKRAAEARLLLNDARYNVDLVSEGKGVHNPEYAVKLMRSAWDQADIAMKAMSPGYAPGPRPPLLGTNDGYCMALCHGRLGLKNTVTFVEMRLEFPHALHHENLGIECTTCHSPDKHKQRIISKEGCMECHHRGLTEGGKEGTNCKKCHRTQVDLYYGKVKAQDVQASPDVMAAGEVGCEGCHDLTEKDQSVSALKTKCVSCHEAGYDDMLIQWEQELLKTESDLTAKIASGEDTLTSRKKQGASESSLAQSASALAEAKRLHDSVSHGRGIHNYQLSLELLGQAEKTLNMVLMEEKQKGK